MKTPVIIPAFNEAERIGATLRSLDANTVEPFVVVNGELGADETAEVARRYTTNVEVRTEQGKLPAVQYALRNLLAYDQDAFLSPILLTDADSQPLFPKQWAPTLTESVVGNTPKSAAGIVVFNDGPLLDMAARNVWRLHQANVHQKSYNLGSVFGSNIAINFAGNEEVIE